MQKKNIQGKPFYREMYNAGILINILLASITFFYTHVISGIIATFTLKERIIYSEIYILMFAVLQFLICPFTNRFLCRDITSLLEQERANKKFTVQERTKLVKNMVIFPRKMFIQVITFFLTGTVLCYVTLNLHNKIFTANQSVTFIFSALESAYLSGIIGFIYSTKICSKYSKLLIKRGIDRETIINSKPWGLSHTRLTNLYMIFPVIIIHIMQIIFTWNSLYNNFSQKDTTINMLILVFINTGIIIGITVFIQNQISSSLNQINKLLFQIKKENFETEIYIPVDLSTDFSYNIYLLNDILDYTQHITTKTSIAGFNILNATQELSKTAAETSNAATNKIQAVKDYISIMEETLNQLGTLIERISNVKESSQNTKQSIQAGKDIFNKDLHQIEEIIKANEKCITCINEFSNLIEETQSLILSIETIAEKTRTIAYNAEIESASAGESGEKFHIIALEIRSLATAITDSISEAKSKIKTIQFSSDTLLITSEAGTQKIDESRKFFKELQKNIDTLYVSSDITAESTARINDIIDIQRNTFLQIQIALKQIRSGFDYFINSSERISETANMIMIIANQLNVSNGGLSLGDIR